jgi:hypothetical protein
MSRILTGLTHAIIKTPTKTSANKSGIYALVDLFYGPGDDNAIRGIAWKKTGDRQYAFQVPTIKAMVEEDNWVNIPVFTGEIATDLIRQAARSMDAVKKSINHFEYGKTYRVDATGAKEL